MSRPSHLNPKPPSARRLPKLPRNVVALSVVSLFNDASSEIIYPLLPLFLTSTLGAGAAFVGLVEGIAESTSSLLRLPAGWFSDRVRRRKEIVVAGYALASLTRPLLALANAAGTVLGLRFLDRLGKGLRSAPRDAMIADAATPEARGLAFGFHRAMDHAGAIIGSLLSAWLIRFFHQDYRSVFWVAVAPAVGGLLTLIFAVREQPHAPPANSAPAPFPPLSLAGFSPAFKRYLGVLLLFTLSNSSDAFLLLRARQAGVTVAAIPLLWAALHVIKSLSSIVGGGLSDRFGRRRLIVCGWLIYAAVYSAFAFAGTPAAVWALFVIYGLYFGLTEGAEKALVSDLAALEQRGTAFGYYNLVVGLGALPASLLFGLLWQRFGAETALFASAALSLIAAALLGLMQGEEFRGRAS